MVANNVKRKGKNLWTSRQGGYKIGYYEAPDGENEALFAADFISKYLREAIDQGQGEDARAAVLYRTNSQSRLYEEAMRRYGLKYHVVGGFSFYERAEIKDMISYLKVIHNPDDSISLLRVINTPVRGIGKTSIETLERVALETGLSLWGAIAEAIKRQLLPPRALAALKIFPNIIEDGRAILTGTFAEHLEETASAEDKPGGRGRLGRAVRMTKRRKFSPSKTTPTSARTIFLSILAATWERTGTSRQSANRRVACLTMMWRRDASTTAGGTPALRMPLQPAPRRS